MTITIFSDVILPNSVIKAGIKGKQIRKNTRTEGANGEAIVNVNWSRTLRQYELGFAPMTQLAWQTIEALHEITEGGAYGFLMSDPKDNAATFTSGVVLATDQAKQYQLHKRVMAVGSTRTKDRKVTRPMASSFKIFADGAPMDPADFSLDPVTGIVSIITSPAAATLAWSGSFYVPVHFEEDMIDWEMVAAGSNEQRLLAGPSVLLMEIRE